MAKRMNNIKYPEGADPDLFILEFAVNDYQGQDHILHVEDKTDVFFDGFQRLAMCAETVVHKILRDHPRAAILFLEFQTALLYRKTAQLLHMGVAQHYQIPVISYGDALWPHLYRLMEMLKPHGYCLPDTMNDTDTLPFPHGCAPCRPDDITEQFRDAGCSSASLCIIMRASGHYQHDCKCSAPCYVPLFAHDDVHPSATGHRIARDFIAEAIAGTALLQCQGHTFPEHMVPVHSGWLVAGPNYHATLEAQSEFVLVKDTMSVFGEPDPLLPAHHSEGFELKGDGAGGRTGWIATNPAGGETISFSIDLPKKECYAIFLSVLKSYQTVGSFTVTVEDTTTGVMTGPHVFDCIWKPRISVPSDFQVTADNPSTCTGACKVTITTNPEINDGRNGNKMKIMSLAVRACF
jgi:hypothetical protein